MNKDYVQRRKKRLVERMRNATGSEAARLATLIYNEFYRTSHGDADGDMQWITSDNGEHMLINNGTGEVVAGAGGGTERQKVHQREVYQQAREGPAGEGKKETEIQGQRTGSAGA